MASAIGYSAKHYQKIEEGRVKFPDRLLNWGLDRVRDSAAWRIIFEAPDAYSKRGPASQPHGLDALWPIVRYEQAARNYQDYCTNLFRVDAYIDSGLGVSDHVDSLVPQLE